jgi:hypothetical protein
MHVNRRQGLDQGQTGVTALRVLVMEWMAHLEEEVGNAYTISQFVIPIWITVCHSGCKKCNLSLF